MSDLNTVNLFTQMQSMASKAEGAINVNESNQPSFSSVFQNALQHVTDLNNQADSLKTRFELGDSEVGIPEVMIAMQKSNIGLEATVRVKNKLVQAYQDVMSMPV